MYCKEFGLKPEIDSTEDRAVNGIGGIIKALGTVMIQIPFKKLHTIIVVQFLVLSGRVPTLLSMRDMAENDLDISLKGRFISHNGWKQLLALENFFLIRRWRASDEPFSLHSEEEIIRIRRSFGHPSVNATTRLLRKAIAGRIDSGVTRTLKNIEEACITCKKYERKQRRFKLTIGTDGMRFNHTVEVDTIFIEGKPAIQMIDVATHFCAADFLRKQSTEAIWKKIQMLWSLV